MMQLESTEDGKSEALEGKTEAFDGRFKVRIAGTITSVPNFNR